MPRLIPDSPLIQNPCPGLDPEAVIAALEDRLPWGTVTPAVRAHVREWCRLGPKVGIYPGIGIGQTLVETGNYGVIPGKGASAWADPERNNPGSIGIVDRGNGEEPFDTGLGWPDATTAARAQIAHLLAYADTSGAPQAVEEVFLAYKHLNPRIPMIPTANLGSCRTVRDLGLQRYAWDAQYGLKIANRVNGLLGAVLDLDPPTEEPPAMPEYNFDPALCPFPPMAMKIVQKPGERAGFDRVPFRGPRIVGICDHITAGNGTIDGYRAFFATGGERAWDALVDVLIDKQGNAAWYNYPYDPNQGGTRSPWASGGSDGLEGDGPAYVRVLGIDAINARLISKEHVLVEGEAVPLPMLVTSARITAAVMQRARVPWDAYPLNPNVGCVTHMQHFEFATKPCPGTKFRNETDRMQDLVRAYLKAAQETPMVGTTKPPVTTTAAPTPTPVPPPKPVENPAHDLYPEGMGSYEEARAAFGTGVKHYADGHDHGFGFNPDSAVSLAWLSGFVEEGVWPEVDEWWELENSNGTIRQVVTFKRSRRVLVHMADRAGWRWV